MKQTLYQILGVDPNASFEDIEIAYSMRFDELKVATIQDPNKLIVLNQARDILSDANRRAAYDASLAKPVGPLIRDDEVPESTLMGQYGKWIILALILIAIVFWWTRRDATPPAPVQPPASIAPEPAQDTAEPIVTDAAPATANSASEAVAPADTAQAQAQAPAPNTASANPIVGRWSCFDPLSGRAIGYDFQSNGTLSIDRPSGPLLEHKYEVSGKAVKLSDAAQNKTLRIEEIGPKRMVLNTGEEGRRLVCTR